MIVLAQQVLQKHGRAAADEKGVAPSTVRGSNACALLGKLFDMTSEHWRQVWEEDMQQLRAAALEENTFQIGHAITQAAKRSQHPLVPLLALIVCAYCYAGDVNSFESPEALPFELQTENALKDALCAAVLAEENRTDCPRWLSELCRVIKVTSPALVSVLTFPFLASSKLKFKKCNIFYPISTGCC